MDDDCCFAIQVALVTPMEDDALPAHGNDKVRLRSERFAQLRTENFQNLVNKAQATAKEPVMSDRS